MKTKEAIGGLFGLVLIGVASYYIIRFISSFITGINLQTMTTLLGITIPLVASIYTIYLGRSLENKKAQQEKIREFKVPIYNDFIQMALKYLLGKDIDEKERTEGLANFFKDMTPKMVIWADDAVIKKWADFRTASTEQQPNGIDLMIKFEEIILAMRKDLGHANKNLGDHELLKCFINDVDKVIGKK